MGFFVVSGIVAVLIVVGMFVGTTMKAEGNKNGGLVRGGSLGVGLFVLLLIVIFNSFHTVDNGHIGLVKQFGPVVGTTGSGIAPTAPWQNLTEVSVQDEIRTYIMNDSTEGAGSAVSRDSQPVFLVVQVRYQLQRDRAVALYKLTGGAFKERILDPAVFQNTKEVTAKYKATEFAANRENIRREIEEALNREVEPHGLLIKNVTLKNVDFTDALKRAIERTVENEQEAKAAQAQVAIKEAQARQAVAEAQGEAQANITRARAERTANILRQRSLTPLLVQQQAIEKLNPNVQIIVCPPRTVCIPNGGILDTGK